MSTDRTTPPVDGPDRERALTQLIRAGVNANATPAALAAGEDAAHTLVDGTGNRFRKEAALTRVVAVGHTRILRVRAAGVVLFLALSAWGFYHPSQLTPLFFPLLATLWAFWALTLRYRASHKRLVAWLAEVQADPSCQIRSQ